MRSPKLARAGVVLTVLIAVYGCRSTETETSETSTDGTRLCIAANPADVFEVPPDYQKNSYGTPLEIRLRGLRFAVPNQQVSVVTRAGDVIETAVDGKVRASFAADADALAKHVADSGDSYCFYFRKFQDLSHPGGFVLDIDRPSDRCTCF